MITKFENAIIIKDFDSSPFIGDFIVDDDKILYVGKSTNMQAGRVIECNHNVIMPGFVNTNASACLSVFNGLISEKKSSDFWAEINSFSKNLTKNDIVNATNFSAMQFAKNGITTIGLNDIMIDVVADTFSKFGLRNVAMIKQRYSPEKFLSQEEIENINFNITSKNSLSTAGFACGSVDFDLEENFVMAEKLSKKYDTFASANACQTLEEVGRCATQNNDLSPVGLLEDYGFFDHKSLCNYGTNLEAKDISILKKYESNVCVMPTTDHKLSNGIAPVYQMLQYGLNVCFGTGIGSIFGHFDMFNEIKQSVFAQNTMLSYADSITSRELLKIATTNGAKSLNLKNVGTLEVGNQADVIMLDISANITHNIFDTIVYSCSSQNVVCTMVSGKIIWDGKNLQNNFDEQEIIKNAKQTATKF